MVNKTSKSESSVWYALSLAWQLGYTIAIPLVVLALVGRLLDRKLGTGPWLLLAGILSSLIISSWLVYLKVAKILGSESRTKSQELRK